MRLRGLLLAAAGAVALSIGAVSVQAAPIITNGGFETGDFTGWTSAGNNGLDGVTPGNANSGGFSAFFGPVGSPSTLSQTVVTVSGQPYVLDFFFEPDGGRPSTFSAFFNGAPLVALTDPPFAASYQEYTFTVTGTGSDIVSFEFRDDPGFLFLDDVSLNPAGVGVPLPATVWVAPLLLGGFGLMRRASRKTA